MSAAGVSFLLREFAQREIVVYSEHPYDKYEIRCPDGKQISEIFDKDMIAVIESKFMDTIFWHALQAYRIKHEFLVCNQCDEPQVLATRLGAASQKRKCHMTSGCEGIMRRVRPEVFLTDKRRSGLKVKKKVKEAESLDSIEL